MLYSRAQELPGEQPRQTGFTVSMYSWAGVLIHSGAWWRCAVVRPATVLNQQPEAGLEAQPIRFELYDLQSLVVGKHEASSRGHAGARRGAAQS